MEICTQISRASALSVHLPSMNAPRQAIHSCAVRFPDVAASVVHLLMDFLGDLNTAPALDVVFFVREIMETNPKLRPTILARLLDSFATIRSSRVCTCALWIVGEYCTSSADISAALEARLPAAHPSE